MAASFGEDAGRGFPDAAFVADRIVEQVLRRQNDLVTIPSNMRVNALLSWLPVG
jgi:hypothetical protein